MASILGAVLYDPAVAVTKATSALLAMTAFDTTNARITFTVPSNGMVRVRIRCTVHGATTFPTILLGVLEGSTVRGRVSPLGGLKTTAVATAQVTQEADFVVPGLTPAANLTWDAAYGVEVVIASTGIKYGGPNNTTTNDAFGALQFEVWSTVDSNSGGGGSDPWATALPGAYGAGTAGNIVGNNLNATVSSRSTLTPAQVNTEVDTALADYDAPTLAELDARTDAIEADTQDIQARLPAALVSGRIDARVGSVATAAIDANAIDATASEEIADALLNRNIAGGSNSGRLVREAMAVLRNRVEIAEGVLTVYAADDTTPLYTAVVIEGNTPISGVNPS